MELTVLAGDDEPGVATERRRLLAAASGTVEEIDVSNDAGTSLVAAVRTPAMFGPRVISALAMESLSVDAAIALVECADGSSAVVVGVAGKALSPKVRAQLVKVGEVRRIDQPRGAGVAKEIRRLCDQDGIRLDTRGIELCGRYPIARVRAALALLAQAGVTSPTEEDLADALGGDQAEVAPWKLTDAVMAGNVAEAARLAEQVQPAVAVSVLTSQYRQLAVLCERGTTGVDEAAELLGIKQPFVAEKLVRLARRFSRQEIYRALDRLGEMALAVRSGTGSDSLVLGVVELAKAQARGAAA